MTENKDIADANNKRVIFKIIIFLSIIMTSIGIFTASYYSSINKVYDSYETTLVTTINGINEVNKSVAQFNSNQTIDVEYAKTQLPNIITDLSKLRSNLANSKPTSKYKKNHENLKSGLANNLLIYRQSQVILNNPSAPEVKEFWDNLKTYRNDCMNFYSLIDIHNIKIELPETSLTFIDNVLNDSYMVLMSKKEADIKSERIQEFISKINNLSNEFLGVKINYYSNVLKVRKKDISYDELLLLVDTNLAKLSKVQSDFKTLSIPPSAIPTYEAFKPLLSMYESYLTDFKHALISEKIQALSTVVAPSVSDALYTSSNAKFSEIESYYNVFIKFFVELKNT